MTDKIFLPIRVSKPSEKAPDWVKLNFGAKVDELVAFLQENKKSDGWINFDLKKSKGNKLYLELNTFEKGRKEVPGQTYDELEEANAKFQYAAEEEDF